MYKRQLRLIGRGDNWHHPGDVSDIVDGLVRCGTAPGLAHFLYNWSLGLPRAAGASFLGSNRMFDLSRSRDDLAYAPTVTVRDAVRRMVTWYREPGLV